MHNSYGQQRPIINPSFQHDADLCFPQNLQHPGVKTITQAGSEHLAVGLGLQ